MSLTFRKIGIPLPRTISHCRFTHKCHSETDWTRKILWCVWCVVYMFNIVRIQMYKCTNVKTTMHLNWKWRARPPNSSLADICAECGAFADQELWSDSSSTLSLWNTNNNIFATFTGKAWKVNRSSSLVAWTKKLLVLLRGSGRTSSCRCLFPITWIVCLVFIWSLLLE